MNKYTLPVIVLLLLLAGCADERATATKTVFDACISNGAAHWDSTLQECVEISDPEGCVNLDKWDSITTRTLPAELKHLNVTERTRTGEIDIRLVCLNGGVLIVDESYYDYCDDRTIGKYKISVLKDNTTLCWTSIQFITNPVLTKSAANHGMDDYWLVEYNSSEPAGQINFFGWPEMLGNGTILISCNDGPFQEKPLCTPTNGTYRFLMKIPVPANTPPGEYQVQYNISAGEQKNGLATD